ncbi:MAG: hypothetical protein J5794_01530 [Lachnospiraceae bacterium]|nr:hypothetical protein [Lachnospiraceae bacterium]
MENKTGKFLVGYSIQDITPEEPMPLGGYGACWFRISNRILDRLYIQCVAMTDADGETLLLCTYDNENVRDEIYLRALAYFREKYGIDAAHFHINASHSESTPETLVATERCPEIIPYKEFVIRQIIAAGDAAIRDRKPARLEYGTTHTWNLNFVRHVFFDSGEAIGDAHKKSKDGNIVQHASKVDNAMLAIKIVRENEPDLVLINWRSHTTFTSGPNKLDVSSDFVGPFREIAKERFGCDLMFFQGCAGNVNPKSYIRSEERTRDYKEFAKFLVEHLQEIYDRMTPVEAGPIRAYQVMVTAKVNHDEDCKIDDAWRVRKMLDNGEDREVCHREALRCGMSSVHHAGGIIRRYTAPPTFDYPVSVFAVGELAFAAVQFEMFDSLGRYVRENSPYAHTFVMGFTDHFTLGYMPSAYAYEYGCYEAENCILSIGSGERCAAVMLESLIHMKYHYGEDNAPRLGIERPKDAKDLEPEAFLNCI